MASYLVVSNNLASYMVIIDIAKELVENFTIIDEEQVIAFIPMNLLKQISYFDFMLVIHFISSYYVVICIHYSKLSILGKATLV